MTGGAHAVFHLSAPFILGLSFPKIKCWTAALLGFNLSANFRSEPRSATDFQMPLDTETNLIQAALAQDAAAWKTLLADYGDKMYGIALRLLRNEKEAEDATQESWILISQKLCEFRSDCKLGTWIYRVTTNKCLERIRASKKHKEKTESIDDLLPDYQDDGHYKKEFPDWSQRPDKEADQKGLKEELEKALNSLPEEYRQVLILRDVEGFDGQETAEMLGLSEAAMKTKLHRGRMALREKLERKFGKKPWIAFLRTFLL